MRIIFFAQSMPDPCGAFFHDIILGKALQARGHTVTYVTTTSKFPRRGVYRGLNFVHYEVANKELMGSDLWSTPHNPILGLVRRLNERFQKPLVVSMHYGEDRNQITAYSKTGQWSEFLWFVSDHIRTKVLAAITVPPSFKEMYTFRPTFIQSDVQLYKAPQRPEGDCITLINANLLKGLAIFIDMAKRFPTKKFLGVKPYYNVVDVPNLPNIEWIPIQDDIRTVLKRTRVLIVPSYYESWGRVAFEAMYNGIPVLYTKPIVGADYHTGSTEGMQAWIGDNGIQCDRLSPDDWVNAINTLDDPEVYNDYSDRAYKCTNDLDLFSEIDIIERHFYGYTQKYPAPIIGATAKVAPVSVGPNRFMSGPMRRPQRAQQAAPAAAPEPAPVQVTVPTVRGLLSFRGGRFGARH
jgi:glycosyltransferase involved in cell wall biosynthesis